MDLCCPLVQTNSTVSKCVEAKARARRYITRLFVRLAIAGVIAFLVVTGGWLEAMDRPVGVWDEGTVGAELHKLVQALAVTIGPRSYMVDPRCRLVRPCEDYPAVMLTDTALFRNPHYHRASDLPERLDYQAMAELVGGLGHVLITLDVQQ